MGLKDIISLENFDFSQLFKAWNYSSKSLNLGAMNLKFNYMKIINAPKIHLKQESFTTESYHIPCLLIVGQL